MFGKLINILKENPKKIVFTEKGSDRRILEAASRLLGVLSFHRFWLETKMKLQRQQKRVHLIFVELKL